MAITKVPFDWNNTTHTDIIDKYKHDGSLSGYSGYYPCDFKLYGRTIYGPGSLSTYKLEVTPEGDEPVFWVSGTIDNKDNSYSAFVESTVNNPKYIF
jgi:hypothetical protein